MNAAQLPLDLDLPRKPVSGRADFVVAQANAHALAMIEHWAEWPQGKLVLSGPAGAGKTHLAHIWGRIAGAQMVQATALSSESVPVFAAGPVAVEDVPRIAGDPERESALFHLHNLTLAERHPLLLTGRGRPSDWGIALPDLKSRLTASNHVALGPPDDALLTALLTKLFADRHLRVKPEVISYILARMERSFAAAGQLVAALDAQSLVEGRNITRALAIELLDMEAD